MKLAIGIDTGGTYTDAVLYDFETKKILHAAKALTTKNDLCVGIGNALDALPDEHFKEVRMLSLSTTLATNACVEGKGGAAKLVFFNGDKDILKKYGAEYGLPPVGEILVEPCRTDISGQIDAYPDWEKFEADVRENCRGLDGIGVIELYSFKNGAVIEKEAKERIAKIADIPVTCGYELFREPNSLQRGAGTLLNAGLYPVIEDFLRAVRRAMQKRGIDSPLVIMRSDGSLMTEEFARKHPVETLLCGPAASVAGGYGLSREKNSVIVDMGGTTTDIAIVRGGAPVRAEGGVTVGKWRTYVDGMLIRTFGLGGDSAVHYRGKKLVLEEYRVVPLCAACAHYPAMKERLSRLAASGAGVHTQFRYEFYFLAREPRSPERYTEREKRRPAHFRRRRCGGRAGYLYLQPFPLNKGGDRAGVRPYAHRSHARPRRFFAVRRGNFAHGGGDRCAEPRRSGGRALRTRLPRNRAQDVYEHRQNPAAGAGSVLCQKRIRQAISSWSASAHPSACSWAGWQSSSERSRLFPNTARWQTP